MGSHKRIATAVLLAVVLPAVVGFLSGFSGFVTGESVTPSWMHMARRVVAWIAVITVFAWFVAGHKDPFLKHFAIVVVMVWLFSEIFAAGTRVVISGFIDFETPIWSFRIMQ